MSEINAAPESVDVAEPDRRTFLVTGGLAAAGGVFGHTERLMATPSRPLLSPEPAPRQAVAAAPPESPPKLTRRTIAEAERLAGVTYTDEERDMVADTIADQVERSIARRDFDLPNELAPAQTFDPTPTGRSISVRALLHRSADDETPLPDSDDDIAFAPVTKLSRWIERRAITSERLTKLYLDRLERFGPDLECVVTPTPELALEQARAADRWLADGRAPRSPLHGIPWGAKDLLDTAGIRTTWGAMPYRDRIAASDAAVVTRLREAGAVLTAKLTLGAIAYGDIWFGGKTRNPFNREEGSSGSSAGSAAATAAGLVGFAIGTETLGSIVSPSMRCGTTGLRPTFGRVARTGAMALCWSMDKIGPIGRTVEDTVLVLNSINGGDDGDPSSVDMPLEFDARRPVEGMRVGYNPAWFEGEGVRRIDRLALDRLRAAGIRLVKIELPDWPYGTLLSILFAEAASAFEALTLDGRDDELVWQEPQAWPNSFRCARFISAIDYVQAERFRRRVMEMMAEQFDNVEAIISPSYAASLLLITNCTGHPSLTVRAGFKDDGTPHGITMCGRLYQEGRLANLGMALERGVGVWDRRPSL